MSSRTHSCGSIATPDDLSALLAWAGDYPDLTLDLGAGDARYARDLAHAMPDRAVLAVDTCGTNATRQLRKAPGNLRFLIADARSLPHQLSSLDCTVVINFPWGSLLAALLRPEPDFVASLAGRACAPESNMTLARIAKVTAPTIRKDAYRFLSMKMSCRVEFTVLLWAWLSVA